MAQVRHPVCHKDLARRGYRGVGLPPLGLASPRGNGANRRSCCNAKVLSFVGLGVDTRVSPRLYTGSYGAPSALHGATARLRSSSLMSTIKAPDLGRELEASTAFRPTGKRDHHGSGLFDK